MVFHIWYWSCDHSAKTPCVCVGALAAACRSFGKELSKMRTEYIDFCYISLHELYQDTSTYENILSIKHEELYRSVYWLQAMRKIKKMLDVICPPLYCGRVLSNICFRTATCQSNLKSRLTANIHSRPRATQTPFACHSKGESTAL